MLRVVQKHSLLLSRLHRINHDKDSRRYLLPTSTTVLHAVKVSVLLLPLHLSRVLAFSGDVERMASPYSSVHVRVVAHDERVG